MNLNKIINILNEECSLKKQETWDNSGLQIGSMSSEITGILLALDVTEEAVDAAIAKGSNLILTHHPFFFDDIKNIDLNSYRGKIVKKSILNDINIFSLHTSLDLADYGVTSSLAKELEIDNFEILSIEGKDGDKAYGYGGIANIQEIMLDKFADQVKYNLDCKCIKIYTSNRSAIINKVAFCGGSGDEFIDDAIAKGADLYITGDIKYHKAQYALQKGLNIIDAGHFYTECSVLKLLNDVLIDNNLSAYMFTQNFVKELYI